jgi:hypothetical protein
MSQKVAFISHHKANLILSLEEIWDIKVPKYQVHVAKPTVSNKESTC